MAGSIAVLVLFIVLLVVGGIGLAVYGIGGLDRWRGGSMERRG
ncbi:MAG TPA: hypothetical protein VKB03_13990 [Conexibacter sp.]|nr:hypothetical protein [Conexibacter sp.]